MKKSKFTEEQIAFALHQAEMGRKLTQTLSKLKIETSISLRMRDEEVQIYGKPDCWHLG
jgi:hypothetical protein